MILSPELSRLKWAKEVLQNLLKLPKVGELNYNFGNLFLANREDDVCIEVAYCGRILKHFDMEMAKIAWTHARREYQGTVPRTSVGRGGEYGRKTVSLQIPD